MNYDSNYFSEYTTFSTLLSECINNFNIAVNEEIDYINSDEYIQEYYKDNEVLFYENGQRY